MAYIVPPRWIHADYPTETRMNYYKSGLDAIYAILGTYQINPAVARRTEKTQGYYLVHRHRWLIYYNAGTIEDPTGVETTISLSATGAWTAYDLAQVGWLYPGKLYHVQGVRACFEDYEGV